MTKLRIIVTLAMLFFAFGSARRMQAATPARTPAASGIAKAIRAQAPGATPSLAPAEAAKPAESAQKVTRYTLPPEQYRKARNLAKIAFWGQLVAFVYFVIVFLLFLKWKLAPKYRNWAEGATATRFLQAVIFTPPVLVTLAVLNIPLDLAEEWVLRKYGLSVQSWGSWFWDWTKGQMISVVIGIFLIWILYAVIRRSARRWWFYFWVVSLPIGLFLFFLQPMVIDPMFHKFAPLEQKDPALTVALENMVQHAGENIPPQRMYWMGAGEKTTALNAYVTGFGASKRVVVWDTTIAKMNTPQIVFVAGHEMGHYVLGHIPKLLGFAAISLFVFFYLGYRFIGGVLGRWGDAWEIRGLEDWASLPALLLLLTIFSFAANPVTNAYSRHYEHQADQYGLEVTHALTPDASQVAAQSFQILGEVNLSDPDPNPVDIFLYYDHPAIPDRIRFCLTYDPWAGGGHGEFVK